MLSPAGRRDPWPVVGFASAAAFAVLTALVLLAGTLPFDAPVIGFVQGLGLPSGLWIAVTTLGSGPALILVGAALWLAAVLTGRVRLAIAIAVVIIGASLFTDVAKDLVGRLRPPGEALVVAPGFGFPSGHSFNSAATYGILAVVAWRSRLTATMRRAVVIGCLALPVSIGLSRVGLGVHYPSDVLGGWLGGLAFVSAGATLIGVLHAMGREPAGA